MMVIVVVEDGVLKMIFEVVVAKNGVTRSKSGRSVKQNDLRRLREVENGFGVSTLASRGLAP